MLMCFSRYVELIRFTNRCMANFGVDTISRLCFRVCFCENHDFPYQSLLPYVTSEQKPAKFVTDGISRNSCIQLSVCFVLGWVFTTDMCRVYIYWMRETFPVYFSTNILCYIEYLNALCWCIHVALPSGSSGSQQSHHLIELARKQRMNTDVRKSVFCVIMSSEVIPHSNDI